MTGQQQKVEELVKSVEKHHEQYLSSLRSLHDSLGHRRRERSDTQTTINESFLPPVRALTGPVFSSGSQPTLSFPPARKSTLDAADRVSLYPGNSPRPLPVTPNPNNGDFAIRDEDLNFIPLLDSTSPAKEAPKPSSTPPDETPRTTKPLTPLRFTDDMLLLHLRDSEFWGETARLLEEPLKRRGDIDLAIPFRDFASYEREGYLSATFEIYDIAADASARKTSVDVDV